MRDFLAVTLTGIGCISSLIMLRFDTLIGIILLFFAYVVISVGGNHPPRGRL